MKNNHGFSALILIIIIGAASLIMATSATWLSLKELDMSIDSSIGKKTTYVAEACLSESLLRFKDNPLFSTSSQSIIIEDCYCTYSTSSTGSEKTVYSNGICQDYNIGLKMIINASDGITINSWDLK